ncbi:MAG: hypothetical protein VX154_01260 [Pseudomonadota bacterium]|nr:hypothetical protein [Pseudomonadota bacterium]
MGKLSVFDYAKAKKIAEDLVEELTWVAASYAVLKESDKDDVKNKFIQTYAGHAYILIQRSLINDLLLTLLRMIDKDYKTSSFLNLKQMLEVDNAKENVKSNYKGALDAFDDRWDQLLLELENLEKELREESIWKALIIHRGTYLAHRQQKPYKGSERIVRGDVDHLAVYFKDIIQLIEMLFLESSGRPSAINTSYKKYAEEFWSSCLPVKE